MSRSNTERLLRAAGFKRAADDGPNTVWVYAVEPFRVRLALPRDGRGRGSLEVNGRTVDTFDPLRDGLHFVRTVRW